ncbi:MAG: hypothetical protein KJ709_07970 [Nanoarchaeota archaeon]|nr:hypothetical protein [Nanoarchaeota archaeon]
MEIYLGVPPYSGLVPDTKWMVDEKGSNAIVCTQTNARQSYSYLGPTYLPGPSQDREYVVSVEKHDHPLDKHWLGLWLDVAIKEDSHELLTMTDDDFSHLLTTASELQVLHCLEAMLSTLEGIPKFKADDLVKMLGGGQGKLATLIFTLDNTLNPENLQDIRAQLLRKGRLFSEYFPEYANSLERRFKP